MTIRVLTAAYDNEERDIEFSSFKFSAGETHVKLNWREDGKNIGFYDDVTVVADVFNGDDLMKLVLILEAIQGPRSTNYTLVDRLETQWEIRNKNRGRLKLILPYLPYSRQDRRCVAGEAFSLKVLTNILLPYFDVSKGDKIITWDVHSPVAEQLFTQRIETSDQDVPSYVSVLENIPASNLIRSFNFRIDTTSAMVISPDAGAVNRARDAASALSAKELACAEKVRDPHTGHITETRVPEEYDYANKDLLIVDDICDGGRTFIELAKVLREHNPRSISLYVTHGIFSKGFDVFGDLIDHFYVANLFPSSRNGVEYWQTLPNNVTFLK